MGNCQIYAAQKKQRNFRVKIKSKEVCLPTTLPQLKKRKLPSRRPEKNVYMKIKEKLRRDIWSKYRKTHVLSTFIVSTFACRIAQFGFLL